MLPIIMTVIIVLNPVTQTVQAGDVFTLDLVFDIGAATADTVDVYIDFDPTHLEVVDAQGYPATAIELNTARFPWATYNIVTNTSGRIDFSASVFERPYMTGVIHAATIRFRAKANVASTTVRFVRSGARWTDIYLGGESILTALTGATVYQPAADILQLSATCPAHYLYVDQPLTINYLITNISGRTLIGGGYAVDNDRYVTVCDDPPDWTLPPMGQVNCRGMIYVEPEDAALGYVQTEAVARKVEAGDYVYSNSVMCLIDQPVRVFAPLTLRGG